MMLFKRIGAALAALALSATVALAQGTQFPAGTIWGNDTAAQRPGKVSTVTSILDRALGSTRGAILERGASGWAIVVPSATVGLAWVSAGTGADPVYGVVSLAGGGCNAALTASNGGILYSTASACSILAGIASAGRPLLSGSNTAPTWAAFSLPASVTSGGVAFFDSTSSMASSPALAASRIVFGGGAGVAPATGLALGTTTQVLHGNAAGLPTWAAVSLTADVSGQLPIANGGCNGTTTTTCFNNVAPTPTRAGDLIYYNGSNWVSLAGNNAGTKFLQEDASGVPSWVTAPGSGTVTSAQISAGQGISVTVTAGANPCVTTCNLTVAVNLSTLTASLGADVAMNNTANYFAGPAVAQGTSGTWFASGTVTVTDTAGAAQLMCKLWDGTTVIASGFGSTSALNVAVPIALSGYLASPAGNIRIDCRDSTSTNGQIRFNSSGNSKDSTLSVFRIN